MKITPMTSTASGVSFMVLRLSTEVGPLKQFRELIVNAIEAIQGFIESRREQSFKGQIECGADPYYDKTEGVRKIYVADNGVGIYPDELVKFFNTLAETGKRQALDQNFGVGFKISTASWNTYGVEVRSWKDGVGHMVRLAYNEEADRFGLEQFDIGGTYTECVPIDQIEHADLLKPDFIADHGTVVVLLGRSREEDTTQPPNTTDIARMNQNWWFQHVVNKQFLRFPFGIKFVSKVEMRNDNGTKVPNTRSLVGYEDVLNKFAAARGNTELSDACVHWWLLDETRAAELQAQRMYYNAFSGSKKHGHVAAIFGYELYDFTSHDAAIPVLQKFGIFAGYNSVVLYVEPKPSLRVTANMTRTRLVLPDGSDLPWDRWANEFYERMPQTLAEHVERHQNLGSKSEDDYVREQIRKHQDLLRIQTKRATKTGEETGDVDGDDGDSKEGDSGSRGSGKSRTQTNTRRPAMHFKTEGDSSHLQDLTINFPLKWMWKSEEEFGLADRAARFIPERTMLDINQDFSILQQIVQQGLDLVREDARERHSARITEHARKIYVTQLAWTVMSAMATFKNRQEWRGEGFRQLIAPESLTAAILPRQHLLDSVRQFVRSNPFIKRDLVEVRSDETAA